jgi:peptidoglycan/LPS O-acetylase OafA/YrhL
MDPVSPLPVLASLLAAVAASFLLVKRFGAPPDQGRFTSIDGLRGYLALLVFLHHSCVWYFYLHTGRWDAPPSNLYNRFGPSGVALFFMITGFLFFSKLLDGRAKGIDWTRLYVSRFMRLVPLYSTVMILLFVIVAYLSDGILHEPLSALLIGAIRWLSCGILGSPDLNGIHDTYIIVAGVMWTLRYEWFFYFSLPLLALTVRLVPPFPFLVLAAVSTGIGLLFWHPSILHMVTFLGGIVASLLVRLEFCRRIATKPVSSFITIACFAILVLFPSDYEVVPLLLLSVAFALMACGNSIFGLLVKPVSRMLGEITYGIYLLHGMALYVTFSLIIGPAGSRVLSPTAHWMVVIGITPILIFVCFGVFRIIESPAMRTSKIITSWFSSHLTTRRRASA